MSLTPMDASILNIPKIVSLVLASPDLQTPIQLSNCYLNLLISQAVQTCHHPSPNCALWHFLSGKWYHCYPQHEGFLVNLVDCCKSHSATTSYWFHLPSQHQPLSPHPLSLPYPHCSCVVQVCLSSPHHQNCSSKIIFFLISSPSSRPLKELLWLCHSG